MDEHEASCICDKCHRTRLEASIAAEKARADLQEQVARDLSTDIAEVTTRLAAEKQRADRAAGWSRCWKSDAKHRRDLGRALLASAKMEARRAEGAHEEKAALVKTLLADLAAERVAREAAERAEQRVHESRKRLFAERDAALARQKVLEEALRQVAACADSSWPPVRARVAEVARRALSPVQEGRFVETLAGERAEPNSAQESAKALRARMGFPALTREQEDANLERNLGALSEPGQEEGGVEEDWRPMHSPPCERFCTGCDPNAGPSPRAIEKRWAVLRKIVAAAPLLPGEKP